MEEYDLRNDDLVGETGFDKVPSNRFNSQKVHRMVDIRTPNFMRLIADWRARGPQILFAEHLFAE